MRPIVTFTVTHVFPERIARLGELYQNLYWSWSPVIRRALISIDQGIWHSVNHHPVRVLEQLPPERLEELAQDPVFLEGYDAAVAELDRYMTSESWYQRNRDVERRGERIAYFSAEFGLHEAIPLYSGGLGVLSGDHTKSASDLSLPFVCVGLMYQMGYFRQRLTVDGVQLESYDLNDPTHLMLSEVTDASGRPLRVSVEFPRGPVHARLWRLQVGRVPIFLLDTNIAENTIPEYRDIADNLYGGDQEVRIMQEIMLGIGGLRALHALGIPPDVTHSNEGHSAFLMLERTRLLMESEGLDFETAVELTAAGSIFTTHTPVPAGNDAFPAELVERYFSRYWSTLGLDRARFMGLGRVDPTDESEQFSMTVLALRLTSRRNGVSSLHGAVSRAMWSDVWPSVPRSETPITGITNGVHTLTWLSDDMRELFDRHLPSDWTERISDPATWAAAAGIPDAELWRVRNHLRALLIRYIHRRLDDQQAEWFTRSSVGREMERILDPSALTIGFARRFATYKRATLLFRDPERALRLFTDRERPLQLLMAGKAHPKDLPGKEFIRRVVAFVRTHGLEDRIIFVEDYDIGVARQMTQGCDVWLNTPRRPLEASGTSGMKAAVNGALNLSVLDGWFPEAFDGTNAFAIGGGEEFPDPEHQDEYESRRLYRALEEEVIPSFYERDAEGVPRRWVALQKRALETMAGRYGSDRMVEEYATRFYFPSSDRYRRLHADGSARARGLVAWKRWVAERWSGVKISSTNVHARSTMKIAQTVNVVAEVATAGIDPAQIRVEAYYGDVDADGMVSRGLGLPLELVSHEGEKATYAGSVELSQAGHAGIALRAYPWHEDLVDPAEVDLMTWA